MKIKLAEILAHYTDHFTGIISISRVSLTQNLERADVFISVNHWIGDSKKVEQKLASMQYIFKRKLVQKSLVFAVKLLNYFFITMIGF